MTQSISNVNLCKNCGYSEEEHLMGGKADVPYCYKFESSQIHPSVNGSKE